MLARTNMPHLYSKNKTALLLFARTAKSEARHKNFLSAGAARGNFVLADHMLKHSRQMAKAAGLPVFICSDYDQRGGTFSERLANAMEDTFDKGFDKVIAIGSDTPALQVAHILQAVHLLNTGEDAVLGPSADGGVYLIGMQQHAYKRESFLQLPWLSSNLYHSFTELVKREGFTLARLQTLEDVDDTQSLLRSLCALPASNSFFQIARGFLYHTKFLASPVSVPHLHFSARTDQLRAPPLI